MGDGGEAALAEDGADGFAVGSGATFQGVDDGQGGLALAKVTGDGLAEDVFGGGEVEDVVDDLEGEAEVAAVFAELRFDLGAGVGDGGAELHGDREEVGRLAEDQVEVFLFVDEVAQLLHLQEFAFDHLLGERDEQVEDAEVALFEGGGKGLHIQPVACKDAFGVAPGGVGGWAAAAEFRLVDDVVVDQGGGVEHLDHSTKADAGVAGATEGFGGEQQEKGPNAFAAAGHEVLGDVGDDVDFRGGLADELLLNCGQVVTKEVEDLFSGRDGEGAHANLE